MTEFEQAIEEARRQHLQAQNIPSDYVYAKAMVKRAVDVQEYENKSLADTERTIRKAIGYKESLRQVYAPLVYKRITIAITDAIFDIIKQSKIAAAKDAYNEYKAVKERFVQDMHAPDIPEKTEDLLDNLGSWQFVGGERKIISNIKKEYLNQLPQSMQENENYADLLAWILTAIRLSDIQIEHDNEVVASVNKMLKGKGRHLRRNTDDVEIAVRRVMCKLTKALNGNLPHIESKKIDRITNEIKKRMKEYDADEFLSQYEARLESSNIRGECEAETCYKCEEYPCTILKAYRKEAQEHVTKIEAMYG